MNSQLSPETYHLFGNLLQFRLTPAETGGAFLLSDCRSLPGAGAPPNKHVEDEAFLVVSGTVEFIISGKASRHGPGSLVQIPREAVHSFSNVGEEPSQMVILNWPGADHQRFFSTAGQPMPAGSIDFPAHAPPPDPQRIAQIGAESRMIFFPPDEAGMAERTA